MKRESLGLRRAAVLCVVLVAGGLTAACSSSTQPAASSAGTPQTAVSSVATPDVTVDAVKTVTLGKSSELVKGCAYHGGGDCPKLAIETRGFSGSYSCDLFRTDQKEPWFSSLQYTGDRSGTANAWFGYDATIFVTCDGVESNHVPW